MADYSTEIAALEAIVNGAVSGVTVDGTSHKVDIEQARKRLAELRAMDDTSLTNNMVRPTVTRIKLGSAW